MLKRLIRFLLPIPKPLVFLKSINWRNYLRLKYALKHEPLDMVLKNVMSFILKSQSDSLTISQTKFAHFLNEFSPQSTQPFLFVSHEATQTGAPLILLEVAQTMKEMLGIQPVFFICRGAYDMVDDFREVGPSYIPDHCQDHVCLEKEYSFFFKALFEKKEFQRVFVNSVESIHVLPHLKGAKASIVSLVHELGSHYDKGFFENIDLCSDIVIFPAQFVKDKAMENYRFKQAEIRIFHQGLLKPEILLADRFANHRQIREELNLSPDARIVLGCGSLIARKGIDIFVWIALSTLHNLPKNHDLHFVWIGDAPTNYWQMWVNRDVEQSAYSDHIHFVGEKQDTVPYFTGSNFFLMTSRGDSFPCVVQEAIAAGLKVIGFEKTGGYPEIIHGDRGVILPYGDIYSAASYIIDQYDTPKDFSAKLDTDILTEFSMETYCTQLLA